MFASLRLSMHAHGLTYVFIIEPKKMRSFLKMTSSNLISFTQFPGVSEYRFLSSGNKFVFTSS